MSDWFLFGFELTADLRSLFCSHGARLELNEETKTGGNRKFLALNACPRGGNFLCCEGAGLARPSPGCAQLGSLCAGLQGEADERAAQVTFSVKVFRII